VNAQPHEEFCPRCGTWVDRLNEVGWCAHCGTEPARMGQVCTRCSTPRPKSHYSNGAYRGKVCRACRNAVRTKWRKAHPEQEAAANKRKYLKRLAARAAQ
jgi:NMD protein affecting ribosome stability and mRNA decay